jgi:hypothetical protein
MQRLRQAALLARLVLAWFALSLGVAVAAPLVKPQSIELVCTGAGAIKLLVKSPDGGTTTAGATLDCPLCASLDAPPPLAGRPPAPPERPVRVVHSAVGAPLIAAVGAAPPPARGPPAPLTS